MCGCTSQHRGPCGCGCHYASWAADAFGRAGREESSLVSTLDGPGRLACFGTSVQLVLPLDWS